MSDFEKQPDISDTSPDSNQSADEISDVCVHESCPICCNPVEITGLYKRPQNEEQKAFIKPYDANHLRCQYPTQQDIELAKNRAASAHDGAKLRQTMRDCFDRIIYILENAIDIHISEAFAAELLTSWCRDSGWKFYHVSCINLPFSLLWAVRAHSLFGKLIRKDSPLHQALLQKGRNFDFQDQGDFVRVSQKDGKFLNANFMLYNHIRSNTDTGIVETIKLRITEDNLCIYEPTINIDSDYIQNILDQAEWEQTERNQHLLDFAEEIFG